MQQHLTQSCRAVLIICERSGRHGPHLTAAEVLSILEGRYEVADTVEILSVTPGLRNVLD